ncbi:hypothetical protein MHTCC0001_30590 [Flavobacteriaceae bacterium MHTCC 0001]
MGAVSPLLLQTIKELQGLKSLSQFALAGGTNLALRFNHRESQDIDLFCSETLGIKHFESIQEEVLKHYGEENIVGLEYPAGKESEQYTYFRFWVKTEQGTRIKVEIIQNMKMLDGIEVTGGVRLVSTRDIGLFKLVSASSRVAKKDIYDLDVITEHIELVDLFEELKLKKQRFGKEEDKNIFDLDEEECPTQNPYLLLKFEKRTTQNSIKPIHSNDAIVIVQGSKSWIMAQTSWRMKVRRLFRRLNLEYK